MESTSKEDHRVHYVFIIVNYLVIVFILTLSYGYLFMSVNHTGCEVLEVSCHFSVTPFHHCSTPIS